MPSVITTHIIPAHIDKVWALVRRFNGHKNWHPAVSISQIEKGSAEDQIGCIRSFKLSSGEELREKLLTLSDAETMFRYSLIETPIPLFNYIAELRLIPVTVQNHCFVHWSARFQTPKDKAEELVKLVRDGVQRAGIQAIEKEIVAHVD
ncbi:MAG: MxaD family protein [Marinovum sp.]|nr:MxaD family protein [Marinovum sp.]|tara:strand:- start:313 stop:759 length:447 start_codon:yes stop_codon:yes gene_type:complete